jgi:hypothetical protein
MDELERFRIRMIGEEHNRRRRLEARRGWFGQIVMLSTICPMTFKTWIATLKTWLLR